MQTGKPSRTAWAVAAHRAAHQVLEQGRIIHEERAKLVARLGEDWLSHFETDSLRAKLLALGFSEIEDLGPSQIAARYFPHSESKLSDKGGHILRATTVSGAHHRAAIASEPSPQSNSRNGERP